MFDRSRALGLPALSNLKQHYESKIKDLQGVIAWRRNACRLIQLSRGVFFLLFAVSVIGALTGIFAGVWAYVVPLIPFAALLGAAAFNETIEFRQESDRIRLYLNRVQLLRLNRDWQAITGPEFEVPENRFHLAKDLDLFGTASLFKLTCLARTPLGIQTFGDWILNAAPPTEIRRRQESVASLTDETELREELQLLSHTVSQAQTDPRDLIKWAEGELWLEKRKWLLWFSRISAPLMLLCCIAFFFPAAPKMIIGSVVSALLIVHIGITIVLSSSIHGIFNSVGYRQRDVSTYADLFRLAGKLDPQPAILQETRETLATGKQNAVAAVGQLKTIIALAQMRRAGLFFLVYIFAQFLFLLDVHSLSWLESWHKKHARKVPDWLQSLANWESLTSLANLAYHQRDWTFPKVDQELTQVNATQIGHPLLHDDQRVRNDVVVGPADSILLVTGSNMSGKSTLLRSIGMNCVLAQAGSVVCASAMSLPPIQVETSMRIGDSVSDGISFFMAELKRLRQITIEAESLAKQPDKTLLFLLDEILQGTNSRERQIAVIRVCEHLLDSGAIGAISTHDLELAEAESIKSKCRTVHFREFFEENAEGKKEMSFDYVMRQGVSPTTNALKLLELVGLSDSASR